MDSPVGRSARDSRAIGNYNVAQNFIALRSRKKNTIVRTQSPSSYNIILNGIKIRRSKKIDAIIRYSSICSYIITFY